MKGYFSKIAQQSGVRFSRQAEKVLTMGEKSVKAPSHIENDEVVMIPPGLGAQSVKTKSTVKDRLPDKGKSQRIAQEIKAEKEVERETARKLSLERTTGKTTSDTPSEPLNLGEKLSLSSKQSEPAGEYIIQAVSADVEPSIDQTVFVEQPSSNRGELVRSSEPGKAISSIPETTDNRYFARTAEIIDGREASQEQVETILLHEVQEWIASGHVPDAQTLDELVQIQPLDVELQEVVRMIEPEPGVVRIAEQHMAGAVTRDNQHRPEGIEEQSFDLSIGTITVVIEGDEKTQSVNASRGEPGHGTQMADARFSRLRRSYL